MGSQIWEQNVDPFHRLQYPLASIAGARCCYHFYPLEKVAFWSQRRSCITPWLALRRPACGEGLSTGVFLPMAFRLYLRSLAPSLDLLDHPDQAYYRLVC